MYMNRIYINLAICIENNGLKKGALPLLEYKANSIPTTRTMFSNDMKEITGENW